MIEDLSLEKMIKGAKILEGTHDFTSFRTKGCQSKTPIKTIDKIEIVKKLEYIDIDFTAKSFLYNQVRIIVGTLRNIGNGKINESNLLNIISRKDRSFAGPTAPSKGLTLLSIEY